MIFVSLTYSSGIPTLYIVVSVKLFLVYWVDKFLILRFFRLTPGYNKNLSQYVVTMLPYAAIIHILFAIMIFSYPYILHSKVTGNIGNNTQYFNPNRMG